jgi:hypothetical protein
MKVSYNKAINKGAWPKKEATIISNDPTIYFQNLFSDLIPCSMNIDYLFLYFIKIRVTNSTFVTLMTSV